MTTTHRTLNEINTEIYGILFYAHQSINCIQPSLVVWWQSHENLQLIGGFVIIEKLRAIISNSSVETILFHLNDIYSAPSLNSYLSPIVWMSPGCSVKLSVALHEEQVASKCLQIRLFNLSYDDQKVKIGNVIRILCNFHSQYRQFMSNLCGGPNHHRGLQLRR